MKNKNESKKITIIIVNYNTVAHTVECVTSIFKSNYNNFSIVIVDNNSEDSCKKVIEREFCDERIHVIENDSNYGFSAANNIGISYALKEQTDYIMLLNNDTVITKDCLNIFVQEAIRKNIQGLECVISGKILNYYNRNLIWYAGGSLNDFKGDAISNGFGEEDNGKHDHEKICTFVSGCCIFGEIGIYEKVKLSEQYFLYYEDVDFCKRLQELNINIFYIPSAVIFHKESVSSRKNKKMYSYFFSRNRLMYIRNNVKNPQKIIAYQYTIIWFLKKIINRKLELKPVIVGLLDFMKGYKSNEHSPL